MTDFAKLVLGADTSGLKTAQKDLDNLSKKSAKTEKSANELGGALKKMAVQAAAAVGVFRTVKGLAEFETAMAEVSTLVDTTTFKLGKMEKAVLSASNAFGKGAGQEAKATYQLISAGAETAADATNLLTAANKLAIGGVTGVETAADGLTSILNAYGLASGNATAVSDAMFVAMRAGKTTIGELSTEIGKVAPLASSAGVSFDELLASAAALTKSGIKTNVAMTGLRAILAAVTKPTTEAVDAAKELNIEFTAAGLASKGLAGFLAEVAEKTGGSTDQIAQLFGGVEALVPVLAFAGQAGKDFTSIMGDMETKAGATDAAFQKMSDTMGFQSSRIVESLKNSLLGLATPLGNVLVPILASVADNIEAVSVVLGIAGGAGLISILPAITKAVWLFNAALLANPIVAVGAALTLMVGYLVVARDDFVTFGDTSFRIGTLVQLVWDKVVSTFKAVAEWVGVVIDKIISFTGMEEKVAGMQRVIAETVNGVGDSIAKSAFITNLSIQSVLDSIGEIGPVAENFEQVFAKVPKALDATSTAAKGAATNAGKLTKEYKDLVKSLKDQIANVGKSAKALAIWNAQAELGDEVAEGMAESIEDLAGALFDATEAQERMNDLDQQATTLKQSVLTDQQRLNQTISEYTVLLNTGRITQEQFNKAVRNAKTPLDEMSQFGIQAARNIQSAFADYLFDPFKDGLAGMLKGFANTIRRMVAEAASSKILQALGLGAGGAFFGGSAASAGGSAAGSAIAGAGGGLIGAGVIGLSSMFAASATYGAAAGSAIGIGQVAGAVAGNVLLGAGLGYLGGGALASLTGGNKENGAIGGAIGGAAGAALWSLGLVGGPVGIGIAIAGALIGSLFGPKPSDRLEGNNVNLQTGAITPGNLGPNKRSEENRQFADELTGFLVNFNEQLINITGGTSSAQNLLIEAGTRGSPYRGSVDGNRQNFNTKEEAFTALAADLVNSLTDVGPIVQTALDVLDFSFANAESSLGLLAFAQEFEQFMSDNEIVETFSILGQQFDALDTQLERFQENLVAIGQSADLANPAMEKIKQDIAAAFVESVNLDALGIDGGLFKVLDHFTQSMIEATFLADQGLINLETVGANITTIRDRDILGIVSGMDNASLNVLIEYFSTIEGGQAVVDAATAALNGFASSVSDSTSAIDSAFSMLTNSINKERALKQEVHNETITSIQEESRIRMDAANLALGSARQALNAITGEFRGIQSALGGASGAFNPIGSQQRAMAFIKNALQTGDLTGTGAAAQAATRLDSAGFTTAAAYRREQAITLNLLDDLADSGQEQVNYAELTVTSIENEIVAIQASTAELINVETLLFEQEIAVLDEQLVKAEEQLNALLGIETGVLSVGDALQSFYNALQEQQAGAAPPGTTTGSIAGSQAGNAQATNEQIVETLNEIKTYTQSTATSTSKDYNLADRQYREAQSELVV